MEEVIESRQARDKLAARTSVLERVKPLETLSNDTMTTEQVAQWYGVDKDALRQLVAYHREEFESNGYAVLRGDQLRSFKSEESSLKTLKGPALATFTRRAVLNVGMLLRDSETAKRVRAYLLNVEEAVDDITREVAADLAGLDISTLPRDREYVREITYPDGRKITERILPVVTRAVQPEAKAPRRSSKSIETIFDEALTGRDGYRYAGAFPNVAWAAVAKALGRNIPKDDQLAMREMLDPSRVKEYVAPTEDGRPRITKGGMYALLSLARELYS